MHYILVAEFADFETTAIETLLKEYVRDGRVSRVFGLGTELWVYEDLASSENKLSISGFWLVFEYCSRRADMLPSSRSKRVLALCREVHDYEYGVLNRKLCRGGWYDSSSSRSTCADVLLRARLDCDKSFAKREDAQKKFNLKRFWKEEPRLRELRSERWRREREAQKNAPRPDPSLL